MEHPRFYRVSILELWAICLYLAAKMTQTGMGQDEGGALCYWAIGSRPHNFVSSATPRLHGLSCPCMSAGVPPETRLVFSNVPPSLSAFSSSPLQDHLHLYCCAVGICGLPLQIFSKEHIHQNLIHSAVKHLIVACWLHCSTLPSISKRISVVVSNCHSAGVWKAFQMSSVPTSHFEILKLNAAEIRSLDGSQMTIAIFEMPANLWNAYKTRMTTRGLHCPIPSTRSSHDPIKGNLTPRATSTQAFERNVRQKARHQGVTRWHLAFTVLLHEDCIMSFYGIFKCIINAKSNIRHYGCHAGFFLQEQ